MGEDIGLHFVLSAGVASKVIVSVDKVVFVKYGFKLERKEDSVVES